ncbi:hypothetical protein Tco_0053875 [Tanacetum coccineum]
MEFAHYFSPNQPGAKSDYDSEDMEEEVEYMTDDEVVMSEQKESNHGYTQNTQYLEEKDDVDEWLNVEITKHMSMQEVKSMKDALISIIKSIRQEMKDDIKKRQFEASTANVSDEVSSIASNKVNKKDDNTLNTAPCRPPNELSPGSFLIPFNIDNHNFYATTTLDAKNNIMPQRVYKYLGLDKLKGTSTIENTTRTNEPLGTINILGHREQGENKPQRPRPCDYSFEEWLKIKIGQNHLHESDREFVFNEWILDSYDVKNEYAKEIGNPYSRRFDEYNNVFNNEIEHLSNEYILRIGKKGYVLDDVWEKCQQNYKRTNEAWYDEGYKEDEMWQKGRSFICITNREDEALPLGRVNGARFKAMIRKEFKENKIQQLGGNYRDRLDSSSCGNFAKSVAVTV